MKKPTKRWQVSNGYLIGLLGFWESQLWIQIQLIEKFEKTVVVNVKIHDDNQRRFGAIF